MTPSEVCDTAGLKGLAELRRMTGQSDQTLINWSRNKPELFEIVVIGAAEKKRQDNMSNVTANKRRCSMNMDEKRYIVECLALEFAKSEDDLRENYSGRGMYGSTCYGIVTDDPDGLIERAVELGLKGARTDNMGLSTIVYWKNIKQS